MYTFSIFNYVQTHLDGKPYAYHLLRNQDNHGSTLVKASHLAGEIDPHNETADEGPNTCDIGHGRKGIESQDCQNTDNESPHMYLPIFLCFSIRMPSKRMVCVHVYHSPTKRHEPLDFLTRKPRDKRTKLIFRKRRHNLCSARIRPILYGLLQRIARECPKTLRYHA